MLNTERLYIADPFNDEHIRLFIEFEKEHELSSSASKYLENTKNEKEEKEYYRQNKSSNEIEQSLFTQEKEKIKDFCHIHGEKDIKSCNIAFAPIKTKLRNRRLITLATEYALNVLGMQEVFVLATDSDKVLVANLEAKGFESLGSESGITTFLKEKEELKELERVM